MPRRPKPGTVVQVALPDGRFAYGRVYRDWSVCFYRAGSSVADQPPVGSRDFMFCVGVYDEAVTSWQRVGFDPFDLDADAWPPPSAISDPISGGWKIYERGEMRASDEREVAALERAAVWHERHLLPRLMESLVVGG